MNNILFTSIIIIFLSIAFIVGMEIVENNAGVME